MSLPSEIQGNLHVNGALSCKSFYPPDGSISDDAISASAAIDGSKIIHEKAIVYKQKGTVTADTEVVYVCRKAVTLVAVQAICSSTPESPETISVDVLTGNSSDAYTTVLTAPLSITSAIADKAVVAGAIITATAEAGDSYQVVVTVSGGTGTQGSGLCVVLTLREDPS